MSDVLLTEKTLARLHGDRAFVKELYEVFLEDFDERLQRIASAVLLRNFEVLGKEAHSLKGVSGTIDALELREVSFQLELASKEEDAESVEHFYRQFTGTAIRAKEAVLLWLESA